MTRTAQIAPENFSAANWARQRDDTQITVAIIMAELSDDQKNRLQETQGKLQGRTTTAERYKRDNEYSEDRIKIHRKIIEHFLSLDRVTAATPRLGESPVFVMLGGRGGSGKSWFENEVYSRERCIVLDADEIKKMLPEYEGWNASEVHEESSDILEVILQYCKDMGLNVVLDATMKSSTGVLRKANEFKSLGFRVEAHYMHLPRALAAKRAISRFCNQRNGRYVPIEVILENIANKSNFDALRPLLDAWSLWDNDVDIGTQPNYVSGHGGHALLKQPEQ